MVMGDSGIFNKANQAKNKTEVAQYEEELRMCILELQADSVTNGTTFNMETIKSKLVEKVKELENTEDIEFPTEASETRLDGTYKGYEFYIDDKYVAHIGDKAKGISLTTSLNPNGWTKGPVTAIITIKSNNGLKKIVPQGENEINLNGDKEYKTIKENITENTTYTYEVTDSQGTTQIKIAKINTIDKNAPEEFTISAENTEEGLKITGTTTDTESGIDKYEYFVKSSTESNYTIYTENPIKNLAFEKYNVYAVAYDKAGNSRKSNEVSIQVEGKRTNISAQDIKNNPEGYYGQEVDYTSANGQNDWKIFHSDGTNIYLITGNYVKVTDDNGNIDESKLNPNTKMQIASGGKNYRVNWNSSNLPTFDTDVSSDIISKFKINTNVFNINSKKNDTNYPNAQCVSTLLNSSLWSSYIDSSKGNNQTAIGGPTVQLWMDSWNARYPNSSDQLYCDNADEKGYFVGSTSKPTQQNGANATKINSKQGDGGELYFANNHRALTDGNNTVDYYWIASTAAHRENVVLLSAFYGGYVCANSNYYYSPYASTHGGIRPIVCLTSNLSLK